MKRLVEEVSGEGLESLLGQRVTLFCVNYFYTGKLIGVNQNDVLLEDVYIIYETGAWTDESWRDVQRVCDKLYIRVSAIESYGVIK